MLEMAAREASPPSSCSSSLTGIAFPDCETPVRKSLYYSCYWTSVGVGSPPPTGVGSSLGLGTLVGSPIAVGPTHVGPLTGVGPTHVGLLTGVGPTHVGLLTGVGPTHVGLLTGVGIPGWVGPLVGVGAPVWVDDTTARVTSLAFSTIWAMSNPGSA